MAGAPPPCWHSFTRLALRGGKALSFGGSNDHKWLVHTDCQRSFGREDEKPLIPTGVGIRSRVTMTMVPPAVVTRSGGLRRREGRASKDHKWLVYTGCQYSYESEDDKQPVPSGFRYFF